MKPHKHAELIKAWADGAQIEFRTSFHIPGPGGGTCFTAWKSKSHDFWHAHNQYRIKPEPKPDVVKYGEAGYVKCLDMYKVLNIFQEKNRHHNLKLTFDGETGELKSAEVLK